MVLLPYSGIKENERELKALTWRVPNNHKTAWKAHSLSRVVKGLFISIHLTTVEAYWQSRCWKGLAKERTFSLYDSYKIWCNDRFCDTLLMTAAETFIEIGQTTWRAMRGFPTLRCAKRLRNCYCTICFSPFLSTWEAAESHMSNISESEDLYERKWSFKNSPRKWTFSRPKAWSYSFQSPYYPITTIPEVS